MQIYKDKRVKNLITNKVKHLKNNKTDRNAKHKFQKAQSRLNIVRKYFGISIREECL